MTIFLTSISDTQLHFIVWRTSSRVSWYSSLRRSDIILGPRVIILNRGSMPRKRTGRKWCNSSRSQCATHSVTSLETARSLANGHGLGGGGRGWGRSMYSVSPGNCSVSYLPFVYGRSLWTELNPLRTEFFFSSFFGT